MRNHIYSNHFSLLVLAFIAALLLSGAIFGQTTEFEYQGSLKDGASAANGNYDFEFALFDALMGGTQIGSTLPRNTVAVAGGFFNPEPAAPAATFVVNSTADASDATPGNGICETAAGNGVCTLRAAIQEANALAGTDTINFNITSGCAPVTNVCTITPASALPTITGPVTINGYTQPGLNE